MGVVTAKNSYKPKRVTASLVGRMVKIVPTRNSIDIYRQPGWLILAVTWGAALVALSISLLLISSILLCCVLTAVAGGVAFFFSSRAFLGPIQRSFNYNEIVCIVANIPDLTIIYGEQKLFEMKMLSYSQRRLFAAITEAIVIGPYHLVKNHGRYYIGLKEGTAQTAANAAATAVAAAAAANAKLNPTTPPATLASSPKKSKTTVATSKNANKTK